jgi:hypothetical protein
MSTVKFLAQTHGKTPGIRHPELRHILYESVDRDETRRRQMESRDPATVKPAGSECTPGRGAEHVVTAAPGEQLADPADIVAGGHEQDSQILLRSIRRGSQQLIDGALLVRSDGAERPDSGRQVPRRIRRV